MTHTATYNPPTDPAAAFDSVRGLVTQQATKFQQLHGGDLQDHLADAYYHWLRCHQDWLDRDDHKRPYHVEVRLWVWYGLVDTKRHYAKRAKARTVTAAGDAVYQTPDTALDVDRLAADLGDDARTVLALVLDTPAELARVIGGKGGEPRNYRSSIRDWLRGLGWGRDRINDSFAEVGDALA